LTKNLLSEEDDFNVFGSIVSLQALYLSQNPFHDNRLDSKFRNRVIYACRYVRGKASSHVGLMYLDGHRSNIEEKVRAMSFVTGKGKFGSMGSKRRRRGNSLCGCCRKTKGRLSMLQQQTHIVHEQMLPSDIYRFELLMEEAFGIHAFKKADYSHIQNLHLSRQGIEAIDLSGFNGNLISLDLSNNFLIKVGHLEDHLKLKHLDLSGNSKVLAVNVRFCVNQLFKLESFSVRYKKTASKEETVSIIEDTLLWLGKTHHFLAYVESNVVPVSCHAKHRIADAKHREKYSFVLSAIYSLERISGRSFKCESVLAYKSINCDAVKYMVHSHHLCLCASHISVTQFKNIEVLNLSGNRIADITNIGFDALKRLKCLDLSKNTIRMKLQDFGKVINKLNNLQLLAVRGNPFVEISGAKKKRRSSLFLRDGGEKDIQEAEDNTAMEKFHVALLHYIVNSKKHNFPLRVIDTELTVTERMMAWKNEPKIETVRAPMALFLSTPPGTKPKEMKQLLLDDTGLSEINLSRYVNLTCLRLRRNKLTSVHLLKLKVMLSLEVLDLRDNLFPMKRVPLTVIVQEIKGLKRLKYLGVWCPPKDASKTADLRHKRRRASTIGLKSHKSLAEMTPKSRKKQRRAHQEYRKITISLLHRLRNPYCELRYLDETEIKVDEILQNWGNTGNKVEKELFRYKVVRRRALGNKLPAQLVSLDVSGHGLREIDIKEFFNLTILSLSNNRLQLETFKRSGILALKKLKKLDISHNEIEDIKGLALVIDKLEKLETLKMIPNPCFKSKHAKENIHHLLGVMKRTIWMDFKLDEIEGKTVTLEDRYQSLNEYKRYFEVSQGRLIFALRQIECKGEEETLNLGGWSLDYIGALGLKASAKPRVSVVEDAPILWTKKLVQECESFKFLRNGSFNFLTSLDLSNNNFVSLEGMYLDKLPKLSILDLRNNKFDNWEIPCRALIECHVLRDLHLRCMKGPLSKPNSYVYNVHKILRGLENVDGHARHQDLVIRKNQKTAIKFLKTIAGVGINAVATCDLSNKGLLSEHFPYLLAALYEVKQLCPDMTLHSNPLETQGVGPGRDHYRQFVVARIGSMLNTLDGTHIGDDERGNAAEWVDSQLKIYGDAAAQLTQIWEQLETKGMIIAKEFAALRSRKRMIQLSLHTPLDDLEEKNKDKSKTKRPRDTGPEIKDEESNDHMQKELLGEDNDMFGDLNDDDDTTVEFDDKDRKGGTNMKKTNVLQSTGALITKFEVFVSFLQVYGIIFNFDLSITWPIQWSWFNKFFMWLPTFFIVDLTYILDTFEFQIPAGYFVYIKFFGTLACFFLISLTYALFKGWSKRKFLDRGIKNWSKTRKKYNAAYFLLLLLCFIGSLAADGTESYGRVYEFIVSWGEQGGSPTPKAIAWFVLCSIIVTFFYLLLRFAMFYMRRLYLNDKTTEKSQFQIFFSKTKRALQRVSLFGLTIWYVPSTRIMLETYGFEFDPKQLDSKQCLGGTGSEVREMFGEPCCLKTFQNETCAPFQSPIATPLQIMSIPLLIIITVGLPFVFYKLIKEGISELNRGGYRMKNDSIQRSIDKKKKDIKNIRKMKQLIEKNKDVPDELLEYDDMGIQDILRETTRLKSEVKDLTERQNDLYTQEVQANPKAQTYLYVPYSYKMRYYKLVSMAQKLILVAVLLFVPPRIIRGAKMWVGAGVVFLQTVLALLYHPFSDGMETLMEIFAGGTNVINCLVGLAITYGVGNETIQDIILFTFNFLNLAVILFTLFIAPVRTYLFRSQYQMTEKLLQEDKLKEFARGQALAAQRTKAKMLKDVKRTAAIQSGFSIAKEYTQQLSLKAYHAANARMKESKSAANEFSKNLSKAHDGVSRKFDNVKSAFKQGANALESKAENRASRMQKTMAAASEKASVQYHNVAQNAKERASNLHNAATKFSGKAGETYNTKMADAKAATGDVADDVSTAADQQVSHIKTTAGNISAKAQKSYDSAMVGAQDVISGVTNNLLSTFDNTARGLGEFANSAKESAHHVRAGATDSAEGLALQITAAKHSVSTQLGAFSEFVGDVELTDLALDASGITSHDIDDGFWSEPDMPDSAGDEYGGSDLDSYYSEGTDSNVGD
jgi:Leucine-rich repeat (LRR) protein